MSEEFLWVEKYRPKAIKDTILPARMKKIFQKYVDDKEIPNLLLTGTAGVGKTTVAMALCDEIGLSYMFINSSKERGIDTLRTKITNYASTMSFKGGRKVIILDEADYLTPEAQAALRGTIEEFSENCSFIFTCNFKSRLIDAIHSRCATVDFTLKSEEKPKMAQLFFTRLEGILAAEKVTYDKQVLVKIVQTYFPDYRRTLGELQNLARLGDIDAGTLSAIADVRKLSELIKHLKAKDFSEMRKWVVQNSDVDAPTLFRKIYDAMFTTLKPISIPQAVVTLARYQYQDAFAADKEINMVACLTEIMVDCEFE